MHRNLNVKEKYKKYKKKSLVFFHSVSLWPRETYEFKRRNSNFLGVSSQSRRIHAWLLRPSSGF